MREARPGVEIETVQVIKTPGRAFKERIYMIPALVVEDKTWFNPPLLEELINAVDE